MKIALRSYAWVYLAYILTGLWGAPLLVRGEFSGSKVNEEALPFTSKLPDVDSIEIYQFETDAEGHILGVIATRKIEGGAARKLATLWRKQEYDYHFAAACFGPAYALVFRHKNKLIVEGQICFACSKIYFTNEATKSNIKEAIAYQGINVRAPQGRALKKELDTLFRKK